MTSGAEVLLPGIADFVLMGLRQRESRPDQPVVHAESLRQFDGRLKPELGIALGAVDVDVRPRLFAG